MIAGWFRYCFAAAILQLFLLTASAAPPPLMLATVYGGVDSLDNVWISEKLDGVRAYWNGQRLISRQGHAFHAPPWFIAGFPDTPLDGELWAGRGHFELASGTVRRQSPDDAQWRRLRYMVFDLPASPETFNRRLERLRELIIPRQSHYLGLVEQFRLADREALMRRLADVVAEGGEGLMLHRDDALYRAGRSASLLKLKMYLDAEAQVIAHLPGDGKYRGVLGALLVETPDKLRFRLGTGFSDRQRANPPPIGSIVTYRYTGTTGSGIPRFASFVRVREP